MFSQNSIVGIVGSGAMGSGIAQVAATANHIVYVFDANNEALQKAQTNLKITLAKLVEKQKITVEQQTSIFENIKFVSEINELSSCNLIIEAIIENLAIKKTVFSNLEKIVSINPKKIGMGENFPISNAIIWLEKVVPIFAPITIPNA